MNRDDGGQGEGTCSQVSKLVQCRPEKVNLHRWVNQGNGGQGEGPCSQVSKLMQCRPEKVLLPR